MTRLYIHTLIWINPFDKIGIRCLYANYKKDFWLLTNEFELLTALRGELWLHIMDI